MRTLLSTLAHGLWPVALLAAVAAAGRAFAAAAEPNPAEVPWERIEAWVMGANWDGNAAVLGRTGAKTDTPEPKAAPAWTPARPGERRAEPEEARNLRARVLQAATERLRIAQPAKDYKEQFLVYALMEQPDKAFGVLLLMLNDKRYATEAAEGWFNVRLWETGLLVSPRPRQDLLDHYFDEWRLKRAQVLEEKAPALEPARRKRQEDDFKARQEYYRNAQNLVAELKDLDLKGDGDPQALSALCERYGKGEPHAPMSYAVALYKMREWYLDFPEVLHGDVQKSLTQVLAGGLNQYKEAAEETRHMARLWPEHRWVKDGSAQWHLAGCLIHQGDAEREKGNKNDAVLTWRDARRAYLEFLRLFPENSHNRLRTGETRTDSAARSAEVDRKIAVNTK